MDFSSVETWFDLTVALVSIVAVVIGIVTVRRMLKEEAAMKQQLSADTGTAQKTWESNGSVRKKPVIEKVKETASLQRETVAGKFMTRNNEDQSRTTVNNFVSTPENAPEASIPVVTPERVTSPAPRKNRPSADKKEKQDPGFVDKLRSRFQRKIKSVNNHKGHVITTDEILTKPPKEHIPPLLQAERLNLEAANKLVLRLKNKGHKLIYKKIQLGANNELNVVYEPPTRRMNLMLEEYDQGETLTFTLTGTNVISQTYQFTIYYGDMEGNNYIQQIAGMGREYPIVDQRVKV